MKKINALFTCSILLAFACSSPKNDSESQLTNSNEWELHILDSIQVDYLGRIWDANFKNGFGYLRDNSSNSLVKFDTTGAIVAIQSYPTDGPGAVKSFSSTAISDQDELFASTRSLEIQHFDKDLNLVENLEMPFISESKGGRRNAKNMSFWKDKLLLWFPGRDGISPYINHFYRDYPLLELFDPASQTSDSLIRLPSTSKFNSELFFGRPIVQFTVSDDLLYFVLSNEALIHIYSLAEGGKWLESIDFDPKEFVLIPGQKEKVGYVSGNTMYEASVEGIYSSGDTVIVYYSGGITEDIFQQFELNLPKNFYKYPEYRKNFLRAYNPTSGLSNEIELPPSIDFILNIESMTKPFYALRNDEYIGEEQEYLTFYKLKLVQK
ncbi:hypothetical protein [Algoriphagus aquimarinus]|uniref:DUF4221 domain-containing protein n=1 Tax=Algoriphagus aquimarinus TaxID=237018 RepID=A0A1I1C235_9BACT|nr:hypothetical protein [Algoriphagus aquimarinus]SFB54968.1 hypothetical protein SAMN04489723_11918 [Algoriphagus aquimarinus]